MEKEEESGVRGKGRMEKEEERGKRARNIKVR